MMIMVMLMLMIDPTNVASFVPPFVRFCGRCLYESPPFPTVHFGLFTYTSGCFALVKPRLEFLMAVFLPQISWIEAVFISTSTGGSVVEFSPATREARVRFPAGATFFFFFWKKDLSFLIKAVKFSDLNRASWHISVAKYDKRRASNKKILFYVEK